MKRSAITTVVLCLLSMFICPAPRADTIIMNDGRKIEGVVTSEGADYYDVKIKIGTMRVKKDTVREVKKLSEEENFINLGNQYLATNNIDAAIEQYNKALQANPSSKAAADAIAKAGQVRGEIDAKKKAEADRREKEAIEKQGRIGKGFGMDLKSSGGEVSVKDVIAGSSAQAIGIKAGDRIIQINDMKTKGKTVDEVADYLFGIDNASSVFLLERECELARKKIDYQKHSFVGVGIFLDTSGKDLIVNSVIVGEPADMAGLKSKDKVVSIEGKSTAGMTVDDAAELISGAEASKVKLVVQRSVELERK
ncbi:MAG TPA: PDZ domain-containing protein [Candidatus Omnitrophota bacterium]|nr:PDZ domain-containing protein [Candidatus Omnitrophota bacterium]HRZ67133.1 PDZ domain-containing protein [Candidatus Omnitrophota bacterium]